MIRAHALLTAFIVSCAPAERPPVAQPPPPAVRPSSAPPPAAPPAASPSETELASKLHEALAYVSEIRGLSAKERVVGRAIGRDEIQSFVRAQLDEETPLDVIQATEAMLYGFGTVDVTFDYRQSLIALMTSQLLGFYDPKRKTFFVGGDLHGQEADVTLWHELVHALQDQHYDLTHVTDWQPDQGDRQAAIHALAEGDATSTMLDAMMKPQGTTALDLPEGLMRAQTLLGSAAMTAPPILVRSLVAPYIDGLAFANGLRRRGGFAAVDEAWRAPPASTEQLLHLEKFLAHEAPVSLPLPPPPAHASDLTERFHDVMGEQTLRLLFEEWLPARTAAEAAADWGGDRMSVFADEARARWAVGWHLRFDSVAAAERAFVAFRRALPLTDKSQPGAKLGPADARSPNDKVCRDRHDQGPIALARRGQDLGVTVGPFTRNPVAASSDPSCAAALRWASQIATN